jgi:hypothetical protein
MRFSVSPELGRMAMREGLELPFIAWSILRDYAVANNLSGHYAKKDFKAILAAHGLTYNRRHMLRILQAGQDIFWKRNQKKIYLRAFSKVTAYFEALKKPCDENWQRQEKFIQIQVTKSIEAIRAKLYWAWFAQFSEKTISRDTIRDLTGLSHDQQRAYEKMLDKQLLVKTNYAHIDQETYYEVNRQAASPYGDVLPEHSFKIEYQRQPATGQSEKVTAIQYQLPNTFLARPEFGNEFIPYQDAPNRAKNAIRDLFRPVISLKPKQRIYWLKWQMFDVFGNEQAFIRAFFQGKKRLWISGHYL